LAYLSETDLLHASPFYWAGFVCIHNESPMQGNVDSVFSFKGALTLLAFFVLLVSSLVFVKRVSRR